MKKPDWTIYTPAQYIKACETELEEHNHFVAINELRYLQNGLIITKNDWWI